MTGYGAGQKAGSRVAVDVEIRSVNGRTLKISTRTPPLLAPREADLEKLVRGRVRRGSVTLFARVHLLRPQDAIRIRPEIVEGLARALEPLRKRALIEGKLSADAIVSVPGAVETGAEDALRPADWKVVKSAVVEALDKLHVMRQREAGHLVSNLETITRRLRTNLKRVAARAPKVVVEHQRRLEERVNTLLAGQGVTIDEATLAREVALLADRSDVTEEVTRLDAHLKEFDGYLAAKGEVGRTLDFLAQEMLRETNTIGSKSSDVTMARAVIALKADIERLKEQAANLE